MDSNPLICTVVAVLIAGAGIIMLFTGYAAYSSRFPPLASGALNIYGVSSAF